MLDSFISNTANILDRRQLTGFDEKDERKVEKPLHGPSEADMERFNREDGDYLDERRSEAKSALWKLITGAVIILIASAMFLNVLLPAFSRNGQIDTGPDLVPATVLRVFDGRTIRVEIEGIEQTVRYIGVEIPQFGDPYYDVATEANRQWLIGQEIQLEADDQDEDPEGRLLRYVWLDGAMVNLNLVAVGLSSADVFGPNDRYNNVLLAAEESARSQRLGIWTEFEPGPSASLRPVSFSNRSNMPG